MYDYNLKAMTPEGRLPPLNDAGYTGVSPSLEEGAELFGREDFRWAATGGARGHGARLHLGRLPLRRPVRDAIRLGAPTISICCSSRDRSASATSTKTSCRCSSTAWAASCLTEAGTYSYDRSKYRRYVLGTWAHNTILVDGQQQHRRGLRETYETERPLDNLWIHNDVFDAADGVYDSGYGPKREIDVEHERTVVFVRPDYWVVVDRLHADGEHTYDVLWHLNNDEAAQDPRTLAAWGADPGVANLMVTPAASRGLALEIVKGRDEPVLGVRPGQPKETDSRAGLPPPGQRAGDARPGC